MTETILVSTIADDADPAFADAKSQVASGMDPFALAVTKGHQDTADLVAR